MTHSFAKEILQRCFILITVWAMTTSFAGQNFLAVSWSTYEAADNSETKIRIKDEGYGIAEINLLRDKSLGWEYTEILFIDIIQEYVQIKSRQTGKTFELFIDWQVGKIKMINDAKKECIYWKTKS